ncbi:hypothetical protein V8C37DRAFT_393368 [Trichoderma ceciliae]
MLMQRDQSNLRLVLALLERILSSFFFSSVGSAAALSFLPLLSYPYRPLTRPLSLSHTHTHIHTYSLSFFLLAPFAIHCWFFPSL